MPAKRLSPEYASHTPPFFKGGVFGVESILFQVKNSRKNYGTHLSLLVYSLRRSAARRY